MKRLSVLADETLPLIDTLFSKQFDLTRLSASQINSHAIAAHDILLIRSVTKITPHLINNHRLKFLATASSGTNHLDKKYLKEMKIPWCDAIGANAISVAEYIIACVAYLQKNNFLATHAKKAGIVGLGHVGRAVETRLKLLGFEIFCYDPPRAEGDEGFHSVALETLHDCDLICLHPALTKTGKHPSYHLIDYDFLKKCRPGTVIINAARGDVIDCDALKKTSDKLHFCLDVYPNEPNIDTDLFAHCVLHTPHIAGHAIEAKQRAIQMIYKKVCAHFNLDCLQECAATKNENINWQTILNDPVKTADHILSMYDPFEDMQTMKSQIAKCQTAAQAFIELRNHYRVRHEFHEF